METAYLPFVPNKKKKLDLVTDCGTFSRYPVKTHVIMDADQLHRIADQYLVPYLHGDDYVFISEKIVAITQHRAFPVSEIKPGRWARILSSFVTKTPQGIGLGMSCTMELAIGEIGLPKILFAALCAAATKVFGFRGVFYQILGDQARAIDGPCEYTIAPYNRYAKLAPLQPDQVARKLSEYLGVKVVIIDANDLGVEVLGHSHRSEQEIGFCRQVFRDNPLGQGAEQTPLCIVRRQQT